jgi:hypothetical protein
MAAREWTVVDDLLVFGLVACAADAIAILIVLAWRALRGEPPPHKQPLKRR